MRYMDNYEVGLRLKKLRLEKNIKMIDATVEFEISTAQYSRLENGQGRITIEVLQKACEYYNTSAKYILFGDDRIVDSFIFDKIENIPEDSVRRILRMLSSMLTIWDKSKYEEHPYYKLFMGGLLEKVPVFAKTSIPYVLEFEKNLRRISENAIIEELNISRFKWNLIMGEDGIKDIRIPLMIHKKYGYDIDFLINNRIVKNTFFDELILQESIDNQKLIMQMFDSIVNFQNEHYLLQTKENRKSL